MNDTIVWGLLCPMHLPLAVSRQLSAKVSSKNSNKRNKGVALRTLKSSTIYLITLKLLFCVCLAHARQQDSYRISGTVLSAATGVALEGATVKIKGRDD